MCGIVGAASPRNVVPILIDGIRRLEYRGYDSTGLAVLNGGAAPQLDRLVSVARVADLAAQADAQASARHHRHLAHALGDARRADRRSTRIRTRATARSRSCTTASSRTSRRCASELQARRLRVQDADRHRGHRAPRARALARRRDGGDSLRAVRAAVAEFAGRVRDRGDLDARAGAHRRRARRAARWSSGSARTTTSSRRTRPRCSPVTQRVVYLEEGDVADVRRESYAIYDARGAARRARRGRPSEASGTRSSSARTATSCRRRSSSSRARSPIRSKASTALDPALFGAKARDIFARIDGVLILACGTSNYAGLVAKYWIESLARIPCQVEIASEYRYRDSVPNPRRSSSSCRSPARRPTRWRRSSTRSRSATRTRSRSATWRRARWCARPSSCILTRAGAEIGVASTKAFTTQLVALFLLAARSPRCAAGSPSADEANWLRALRHLPAALQAALALEP